MLGRMHVRERLRRGLARQLGHPEGLRGRLVARRLNRHNRGAIEAAVDATGVGAGQRAADIGFGGGIGLQLLLDRVGPTGHVDGVDISDTMLAAARRTYRNAATAGRLTLQSGGLVDLPLDTASVDALITVNTIYFVDELDRAFTELARVLRNDGTAVIGIGDPDAMAEVPVTEHGFRLRPVDEVVAALRAAGLGSVRDERIGSGHQAGHLLVAEH